MKKIEMYEFVKNFGEFDNLEGYEFVKTITKNYDNFKTELESLEKAKDKNEEFSKYREEVQEVIVANSEKDEAGNPVIIKGENGEQSYSIIKENVDKVNKKIKVLDKKYEKCIAIQKENEDKFIKELNSDVGDALITVDEEHVPKNINSKQYKLVLPMVKFQ